MFLQNALCCLVLFLYLLEEMLFYWFMVNGLESTDEYVYMKAHGMFVNKMVSNIYMSGVHTEFSQARRNANIGIRGFTTWKKYSDKMLPQWE